MAKLYRCIEDFEISYDWYGTRSGKGKIRKGSIYIVEREPTPQKKLYKLLNTDTRFVPRELYLRKSELNKYFKEAQDE